MSEEDNGQNATATEQMSMADIAAGIQVADAVSEGNQAQQTSNQANDGGGNQQDMADFIASQKTSLESLSNDVKTSNEQVAEFVRKDQLNTLNQAVDSAVAKINTDVNGDSKLADTFLNSQYQNNPDFKKIFDARDSNPAAYEKALGVIGDEWKAMNVNSIDSTVAENQRALQESQRGGGTTDKAQTESERLSNMPDGDFMQEMRRLARSN